MEIRQTVKSLSAQLVRFAQKRLRKAKERDRRAEKRIEAISILVWRWRLRWLVALVGLLAFTDYATTCIALELSGSQSIEEGGLLAGWALRVGGLGWLFLIDLGAVLGLLLVAMLARFLFFRLNYRGFARAAFVAVLIPYAVVAFAASVNNLILTFV